MNSDTPSCCGRRRAKPSRSAMMRYAAPELFTSALSRHCDQYSLALVYAEMLTGVHPFRGLGPQTYLAEEVASRSRRLPAGGSRGHPASPRSRSEQAIRQLHGDAAGARRDVAGTEQAIGKKRPIHFAALVASERNARRKSTCHRTLKRQISTRLSRTSSTPPAATSSRWSRHRRR